LRLYIFEISGAIKRVPRRTRDDLIFGYDGIPEYAGTRQKVAEVLVENENGKPVRILDAQGSYWLFDKEGRIDQDLQNRTFDAMQLACSAPRTAKGKVVDLQPELKRKKFKDQYRWNLTVEDLNRIKADLWPHLADAEEIKTITGKAAKRPPLTHEAKDALADIEARVGSISQALEDLSEPALKGLAYEANGMAKASRRVRFLWSAIAQQAERERKIKAHHRTGRGVFYAVLHVWHQDSPRERTEIDTVEVQCNGKKAAVEAARHLLAENAHRFSEHLTLEVEIASDQEWEPVSEEWAIDPQDTAEAASGRDGEG
jgi:hypothetical protein